MKAQKTLPSIKDAIKSMNESGYGVRRGIGCYIVYFLDNEDEKKKFPDGGTIKFFSLAEMRHAHRYGW